jgi:hypothetical protein
MLLRTLPSPAPATPSHEGPAVSTSPAPRQCRGRYPRRRRLYLQITFGLASIVIAVVVLYLIRDVLGAFVLGGAIAFLIQPGIHRLTELGVPRLAAIGLIFIVIILALAGIALLVVPLGVGEVSQLQAQAPDAEAQSASTTCRGRRSAFSASPRPDRNHGFLSPICVTTCSGCGNAVSIGQLP